MKPEEIQMLIGMPIMVLVAYLIGFYDGRREKKAKAEK